MKTTKKTISIDQAIKAGNEGKNQTIKQRFIQQHVFANVGTMCEYILNKSFEDSNAPFSIDDVENMYSLNEDAVIENALSVWDEKEEQFKEYANDPETFNRRLKTQGDLRVFIYSLDVEELEQFVKDLDLEVETEPAEILEWWAVSDYLHEKLKQEGHAVVECGALHIWGRCTSGQAILLDGVITRICANMEILENQSNSWA